jgi:chloramphenicol-sensitive protein RarD
MNAAEQDARRGFWAAFAAFVIWGMLPLYIRQLAPTGAVEIMAHRVIWACLFVFVYLAFKGEVGKVWAALRDARIRTRLAVTAALITVNWLVYVWAVSHGHVVESSLGYFINPLVSVLLGVFVLKERLNRWQWLAVSLAALGVLWLTVQVGRPPWIALTLALSFGLYGLLRKQVAVESVPGLGVEVLLIAPVMFVYLLHLVSQGQMTFAHHSLYVDVFLIAGGAVTAIPLVLFAYGVRRVPLSTIGILQYVGPSLQLLTGVFLFKEPFTAVQAVGFGLIWAALVVYAGEGLWRGRRARLDAALAAGGVASVVRN